MKLTEEQLASLSSQKSVNEFLETQRESITNIIKQNLAVGDIFKRENLEVLFVYAYCLVRSLRGRNTSKVNNKTLLTKKLECSSQQMN